MLGMHDCRCTETLSANRLNGYFQSRLCSLYNLSFYGRGKLNSSLYQESTKSLSLSSNEFSIQGSTMTVYPGIHKDIQVRIIMNSIYQLVYQVRNLYRL